jgi:hypothetical protein
MDGARSWRVVERVRSRVLLLPRSRSSSIGGSLDRVRRLDDGSLWDGETGVAGVNGSLWGIWEMPPHSRRTARLPAPHTHPARRPSRLRRCVHALPGSGEHRRRQRVRCDHGDGEFGYTQVGVGPCLVAGAACVCGGRRWRGGRDKARAAPRGWCPYRRRRGRSTDRQLRRALGGRQSSCTGVGPTRLRLRRLPRVPRHCLRTRKASTRTTRA